MNGPPSLSVTDMKSKSSDQRTFCPSTTAPSRIGSVQTRTFGTPSTVIWQFGQWPEQQRRPRGRWYLNEREKTRLPAANAADAIVSPSKPVTFQPAKVNETAFERSIGSPTRGSSLTPASRARGG